MTVEGWELKQLDEIGAICSGSTPSTIKPGYWDGDIVWVTPNDLSKLNTPYLKTSNKKITQQGLKSCSAQMIPAGSIILSSRAPIGYVAIATVECCTNQGCKSFNLKQEYDSEFVYYNLNFNVDKIKNLGEGTTFAEISKTALAKVKIPFLENKKEQTQISTILSTIDRVSGQTEAIIAKQQRIKTGLMQDLLTKGIDEDGNVRSEATHEFKDSPLGRIPVEWDVKSLDKIASYIVDCPHTTPSFTEGGVLVARTFNISDGVFNLENASFISETEYRERVSRLEPRPGDLIFTREAPVGEAFVIPEGMRVCLGQRTMLIRCNETFLSPSYLLESLYSEEMRIRFDRMVGGTTNPHLNVADVRSLLIKQPKLQEQIRIANILAEIRLSLCAAQKHNLKLQLSKTGLMQDLLTGNVRVTALLNDPKTAQV